MRDASNTETATLLSIGGGARGGKGWRLARGKDAVQQLGRADLRRVLARHVRGQFCGSANCGQIALRLQDGELLCTLPSKAAPGSGSGVETAYYLHIAQSRPLDVVLRAARSTLTHWSQHLGLCALVPSCVPSFAPHCAISNLSSLRNAFSFLLFVLNFIFGPLVQLDHGGRHF
eukprot:SAG11_NODE_24_length_24699_cov_10.132195_10_plen_174_part_00